MWIAAGLVMGFVQAACAAEPEIPPAPPQAAERINNPLSRSPAQRSILDSVMETLAELESKLPADDLARVRRWMAACRATVSPAASARPDGPETASPASTPRLATPDRASSLSRCRLVVGPEV